jgi:hypothetical protein
VVLGDEVLGTVNLLAEEHHFTPARLSVYQGLIAASHDRLCAEMLGSRAG